MFNFARSTNNNSLGALILALKKSCNGISIKTLYRFGVAKNSRSQRVAGEVCLIKKILDQAAPLAEQKGLGRSDLEAVEQRIRQG